jgi:uncharacterized protein YhaN
MRINGWHVGGFGLLADQTVQALPAGLTVVHGPNEAGKSTMLAFIRGVLFGFPDGRSSERRYPPLRGGQPGGRLLVESEDGQWVIERSGTPFRLAVSLPGGAIGSKDDLSGLLGGADKELFRNIFAFSLEELSEFHALEGEKVRERIFATPVIGAARSPSEAIRALDNQRSKLLKPRASSDISDLKRSLRETERAMREAQRVAASYPRAVRAEQEAAREVERLSEAWSAAQATVAHYERLSAAWPDWSERSSALEELATIQVPDGASQDAAQRLDEVLADVREARRGLKERREELSGHLTRLERVSVDDRLPPLAAEAKDLAARLSVYEADRQRLSEVKVAREAEESKLLGELSILGPAWDRGRVAELDISIPTADEVRAWSARTTEAKDRETRLGLAIDESANQLASHANERARLETELLEFVEVEQLQVLEASERTARRVSAFVAERAQTETKLEYATRTLEDRRMTIAALPVRSRAPGPSASILLGLAGLLALLAITMAVARQWPAAGGVAAAAVAIVAIGIWGGAARGGRPTVVGEQPGAAEALREAQASLERHKAQLRDLDAQIADAASELDLPAKPSPLDVEEALGRITKQRDARTRADELSRQIGSVAAKAHEIEDRLLELNRELGAARAESGELGEEWNVWRVARGIPEPLAPELMTDLFTSVHRCRESLGQLSGKEREERELRHRLEEFEAAGGEVLETSGGGRSTGPALSTALRILYEGVIADEGARKDRRGLEAAIEGTERDVEEVEDELRTAEARAAAVLGQAGAKDEAELRELVARLARRGQLEEKVAGCDRRIEAQIGRGTEADELRTELDAGALGEWEMRRQEVAEQAQSLHLQRDDAVRRHQDSKQETARIGESSDVARLETEAEGMRQQLSDAISRWNVATLARSLIEATLSRFEREHQPKVVARASALFKEVTSGRYQHLVARDGILEALDERDVRVDAANLSTGTVQQLYLCMRFGLAEEFADRGTSLPLIMDEVLVNFDPERARAMARAIVDVSARHQVLLFTCHPETVKTMEEISPELRVIELARYG